MDADRVVIKVNANGMIFSQDAATGCVINGQVSTLDMRFNAYRISTPIVVVSTRMPC